MKKFIRNMHRRRNHHRNIGLVAFAAIFFLVLFGSIIFSFTLKQSLTILIVLLAVDSLTPPYPSSELITIVLFYPLIYYFLMSFKIKRGRVILISVIASWILSYVFAIIVLWIAVNFGSFPEPIQSKISQFSFLKIS